jgi:4-hydroxybenzoyl-CoA reductase beta subunit
MEIDMIPYDFDYERPDTLEKAAALLRRSGSSARVLAGGTDLLPNMRIGILQPALLVSLGVIEPLPPEIGPDGSIRIDALTRLASLVNSDFIRSRVPMLAESAHAVGGNQIRQMGTLGGNLCQETRCLYLNQAHDFQFTAPCYKRGGDCCYPYPGNRNDTCWSVYMSDIAPALIAQEAEIEILGEAGIRRIRAEALFSGNALNPLTLARAEIIRSIVVPPPPPYFGWGYHKSTIRGGLEFAMANMAVALHLEADGKTCASAKVVVGAVSEGPLQASVAVQALVGQVLDVQRLSKAADDASAEINPLPHHGLTRSYLKENIRVHLRRTFTAAFDRACGQSV